MKTVETKVTETLQIWAIPHSKYHRESFPEDPPFFYSVRTDKPWDSGAVKVNEEEITFTIPAGIDITTAAVDTLKAAIAEIELDTATKIAELREQIKGLLQLTYQPPTTEEVVTSD